MQLAVTFGAERNEIVLGVRAGATAKTDVVDLQLSSSPAALAAPAVALKHLLPEAFVEIGVEPKPARFGTYLVYEAALM